MLLMDGAEGASSVGCCSGLRGLCISSTEAFRILAVGDLLAYKCILTWGSAYLSAG